MVTVQSQNVDVCAISDAGSLCGVYRLGQLNTQIGKDSMIAPGFKAKQSEGDYKVVFV